MARFDGRAYTRTRGARTSPCGSRTTRTPATRACRRKNGGARQLAPPVEQDEAPLVHAHSHPLQLAEHRVREPLPVAPLRVELVVRVHRHRIQHISLREVRAAERGREVEHPVLHEPVPLVREQPPLQQRLEILKAVEQRVLPPVLLTRVAEPAEPQPLPQVRHLRDHAEQLRVGAREVVLQPASLAVLERRRLRAGHLVELPHLAVAEQVLTERLGVHEQEPGLDVERREEARIEQLGRVAQQPLRHHRETHQLLPQVNQQVARVHAAAGPEGQPQGHEPLEQNGGLLQLAGVQRVRVQGLLAVVEQQLLHEEPLGAHERIRAEVETPHVELLEPLAVQVPGRQFRELDRKGVPPEVEPPLRREAEHREARRPQRHHRDVHLARQRQQEHVAVQSGGGPSCPAASAARPARAPSGARARGGRAANRRTSGASATERTRSRRGAGAAAGRTRRSRRSGGRAGTEEDSNRMYMHAKCLSLICMYRHDSYLNACKRMRLFYTLMH